MADYTLYKPEFQGSDYVTKINSLCDALQAEISNDIILVTNNITVAAPIDLDALAAAVAVNSAKSSNATHTGDATGDTILTIQPGVVTYAKIQNAVSNNVILGNNTGANQDFQELTHFLLQP